MLCLAHKVSRKELGIGGLVSDNQNLARSCNHININGSVEELFGGGYKDVARADDFVNLGHALSAVSHSRNRLCAAHQENSVNSCDFCRRDDVRVRRAVLLRRSAHYNLLNACDFCRNGVHQHRRRICRRAAGNVNSDAL